MRESHRWPAFCSRENPPKPGDRLESTAPITPALPSSLTQNSRPAHTQIAIPILRVPRVGYRSLSRTAQRSAEPLQNLGPQRCSAGECRSRSGMDGSIWEIPADPSTRSRVRDTTTTKKTTEGGRKQPCNATSESELGCLAARTHWIGKGSRLGASQFVLRPAPSTFFCTAPSSPTCSAPRPPAADPQPSFCPLTAVGSSLRGRARRWDGRTNVRTSDQRRRPAGRRMPFAGIGPCGPAVGTLRALAITFSPL